MTSARLVVFAYSDLGHACLKYLLDHGHNVVALYTHKDSPTEKIWFASSAKIAQENNVPVVLDADFKNPADVEKLKRFEPDLLLSFYYRNMIPVPVLKVPRLGAYNMHGSFLPKYRGRAPVNWAVLHGEKQTGATLHVMVEKPDAGDIVDQEAVLIGPDDTTAEVQSRVTKAAVQVLARQIKNLEAGTAPLKKQDASQATYFGRRTKEDGTFDWNWPAQKIHNLVRAVTHPYPGALTTLNARECVVWKTRVTGKKVSSAPGHIRKEGPQTFVTCGDGIEIEILEME